MCSAHAPRRTALGEMLFCSLSVLQDTLPSVKCLVTKKREGWLKPAQRENTCRSVKKTQKGVFPVILSRYIRLAPALSLATFNASFKSLMTRQTTQKDDSIRFSYIFLCHTNSHSLIFIVFLNVSLILKNEFNTEHVLFHSNTGQIRI